MIIKHTICPSCSVGCGINLININEEVLGTYPFKKHPVNEGKNCIKGRDCFEIINNQNRIKNPLIRKNNNLVESNWDNAIHLIAKNMAKYSNNEIGLIASGNSTNEELEAIRNFAKKQGIKNLGYFMGNLPKYLGDIASLDEINHADFIFVIGDVLKDNPLIGRRIIIAKENGVEILGVDTVNNSITQINSTQYIKTDSISQFLEKNSSEFLDKLTESSVILFNKLDEKNDIEKILELSKEKKSKIMPVFKDCNSKGAMNYFLPLNSQELETLIDNVKVLLVFQDDTASYIRSLAFKGLDFLAVTASSSNKTTDLADVVLPGTCWAEKDGSFTNTAGTQQMFSRAVLAPEGILDDAVIIQKIDEQLNNSQVKK